MRSFLGRVVFALAAAVLMATLTVAPAQDKGPKTGVLFEVYQDKGGDYRFRIKSGDSILATSGKGYENKAACEKVIDTIKKEAAKASVVEAPKQKK